MTFVPADPIPSGRAYPVREVAGRKPEALSDFAGADICLTLDYLDGDCVVTGSGSTTPAGVRFHEKDAASGKDVRVWRISEPEAGHFTAETVGAGQA